MADATPKRCPRCDKPLATEEDYDRDCGINGSACAHCVSVCWSSFGDCTGPAVDWRARALAATEEIVTLRAKLASLVKAGEFRSAFGHTTLCEAFDGPFHRQIDAARNCTCGHSAFRQALDAAKEK